MLCINSVSALICFFFLLLFCVFYFFCLGARPFFVAMINSRGLRGHAHHGGETRKEAGMGAGAAEGAGLKHKAGSIDH